MLDVKAGVFDSGFYFSYTASRFMNRRIGVGSEIIALLAYRLTRGGVLSYTGIIGAVQVKYIEIYRANLDGVPGFNEF